MSLFLETDKIYLISVYLAILFPFGDRCPVGEGGYTEIVIVDHGQYGVTYQGDAFGLVMVVRGDGFQQVY